MTSGCGRCGTCRGEGLSGAGAAAAGTGGGDEGFGALGIVGGGLSVAGACTAGTEAGFAVAWVGAAGDGA